MPDLSEPPDPVSGSDWVSLAEVSRILHVPMATVRSWELRYAIPQTLRPSGKHRRYTPPDLYALTLLRDAIGGGARAGVAAQAVRSRLGLSGPPATFIKQFLSASAHLDADAMRYQLDRAAHTLALGNCLDDVLFPAMRQVGLRWAGGDCDIDHERLTTETVRSWLHTRTVLAPAPVHLTPVVLACGPVDQHTLGLEALGVLLRHRGRTCRQLGARTPIKTLTTAVHASDASAVVVVSQLSEGRSRAIESLHAAHELGASVFYAGAAFGSARYRRDLCGTYLGTRLQPACALIDAALTPINAP